MTGKLDLKAVKDFGLGFYGWLKTLPYYVGGNR